MFVIIVIAINGAKEILFSEVVALGSASCCYINPRDIFTDAVRSRARAIIIAHNHPSSSLEASDADIKFTKRISYLGSMLGIPLLDHLIISKDGYVSLGKLGHLQNP